MYQLMCYFEDFFFSIQVGVCTLKGHGTAGMPRPDVLLTLPAPGVLVTRFQIVNAFHNFVHWVFWKKFLKASTCFNHFKRFTQDMFTNDQ